jgi:DNA polymerase-1
MKLAEIVMQASAAVLDMKEHGVLVDKQKMNEMAVQKVQEGIGYEAQLAHATKPGFNPRSQDDCIWLFNDLLGFPKKWKRAARGKPAPKKPTTNDEAIKAWCLIDEPTPGVFEARLGAEPDAFLLGKLVLQARSATKLASTYYALKLDETDRVHPDWKMMTNNGRYSCVNPPIQTYPPGARHIFIAPAGQVLSYTDKSQIEFRIMIWAAKDPVGMELLAKGGDIHRETAAEIFNKDQAKISSEERFQAKFVNFGLPYGRGPDSMAQQYNMSRTKAQSIFDAHHHRFSVLWDWLAKLCEFSKKHRYIEEPFGRRRYFIETPDDERERETQNFIPSATAHCLLMQDHIEVRKELKDKVATVADMHDALLNEHEPSKEVEEHLLSIFQRERLPGLSTPAAIKTAVNWGLMGR